MHVPIRPAYTSAAIARKLARCGAKALEWAALILECFGLAALARDVRAACADELRAIALHLRALIVLKALADAPLEAPRKRIAHPHAAPPGCRYRAGYGSSRMRLATRVIFKGTGLTSRDPRRLAAAIAAVARDAARYAARLRARVARGFAAGLLVMTRPPARTLITNAPPLRAACADTS